MLASVLLVLQGVPDWADLTGVLTWLIAGGGGTFVVTWLVSYLAEHWPGWHKLPYLVKLVVPAVVSFAIAIGAQYALNYPELIALIQPFWALLITAILGWMGALAGHGYAKGKGVSAKAKGVRG